MKTTVEIADDLYREAKAIAALRGRKFKDLVEEGLRHVVEQDKRVSRGQSVADLMKGARGIFASGVPDLDSNPEHVIGYGRDARRNR